MLEGINWFDAVVIALIVLFGLRGLANGIIKEIFGILGLIGGLILAVRYKAMAGAWISEKIYNLKSATSVLSGDSTELLAGFLAILFGTWIICLILGEIISKFFKWSGLGFVDKLGGFIFSSAKIFLIFAVIATMIKGSALLNEQTKGFFSTSAVYPHLVKVGDWIMQMKDDPSVKENINAVQEKINEAMSEPQYQISQSSDINSSLNVIPNLDLSNELNLNDNNETRSGI